VKVFANTIGGDRVHIVTGPKKGFAANFLNLVCNPNLKADAYAYSDQDDIWMADKLDRAAHFLDSIPGNIPALYCSRTLYVDQDNRPLGSSQAYLRPASFANALVQNIASGNTMVFNDAARIILKEVGPQVDVDLHDWLTYLLVAGAGGQVLFDQQPSVRYRQHTKNIIGMNTGVRAKIGRIQMLFRGRFADWNERHVAVLKRMLHVLTPQNKLAFEQFANARQSPFFRRLVGLKKSGVYRQTLSNNIAFFLAAVLGKV
jgi:hypothetical protein